MPRFFVAAFCFAVFSTGQVSAELANGAVPGLMPPLMELQVAARLEAKTLRQLGQILEDAALEAFKRATKELKGAAAGFTLTSGRSVDRDSWRFGGLTRETGPIWLHLSSLMKALSNDESFDKTQREGLRRWYDGFEKASRALMFEPSLGKLSAVCVALEAVEVPLRAFDAPETVFLEMVLNASKLQRRSFDALDFFATVQNQLKAVTEKKPSGNPVFDGITLDAEAAVRTPQGAVFQGLDNAFTDDLERFSTQMEDLSNRKGDLLGGDVVWFRNQAGRARALAGELKSGKFAALVGVVEWSNEVYAMGFNEPSVSPALLIHSQMMLMGTEMALLKRLGQALDMARKQGASGLTLERDGMKVVVKGVDLKLTFEFVEVGSLQNQVEVTLRLAKDTLERSTLDKENTAKLQSVISSLENQLGGLSRPTLGTDWASWIQELAKLVELYNF